MLYFRSYGFPKWGILLNVGEKSMDTRDFQGKNLRSPLIFREKIKGPPRKSGTPPGTFPLYGPLGIFLLNSLIKTSFINEKFNCLIVIITIN